MHTETPHMPVMLSEVLQSLDVQDGDVIVDGTFGAGGYSKAILQAADCIVYAIDRDPDAIKRAEPLYCAYPNRFRAVQGCFGNMRALLSDVGVYKVDGIVLDIGVSSPQLDDASRGFSFKHNGPLDMRMSKSGDRAYDVINGYAQRDLARIIRHYGEEKMAGKVASAIVQARTVAPIETTTALADIVRRVVRNKNSKIDPATRTFQAIRIAINDELGELETALQSSISLLHEGGRLAVVSFHSLEDRMVKRFIKDNVGASGANRHLPMAQKSPALFTVKNHKPIVCTHTEAGINPRSRSAKLRTAMRTHHAPCT